MSDNYSSPWSSTSRLDSLECDARGEGYTTGDDAYQVSQRISAAQRKADRKAIAKLPSLSAEFIIGRLPDTIIRHLSVDDVCRETLLLVDLLRMDNVSIG
jgi:hypothetical protein